MKESSVLNFIIQEKLREARSRENINTITCEICGAVYSSKLDFCPQCAENEQLLEERLRMIQEEIDDLINKQNVTQDDERIIELYNEESDIEKRLEKIRSAKSNIL